MRPPPPRQIPVNRQRPRFYPAALLLCAGLALPAVSGGPPLVALSPRPDKFVLSWQPQPQSANFLQVSDNLLDWNYHYLTLPGSSPMRSLDFPATPGPRFFRAVSRPYAGNDPDAEDFDGDGLSTRDEILIFGTDPLVRDSDGNGVADGGGDSDLDGLPDSVEIRAGLDAHDPADAGGDLDRDGITNLAEYQAGTDPANPDTDHDGLGDAWESLHGDPVVFSDSAAETDLDGLTSLTECLIGISPDLADTDGNGISDADEDADLDGVSNLQEQAAGTSPTDYYGGKSVSVTLVSGDYQAISPGETTAPVTVKVARAGAAGAALANAPIFVAPTCAGTAGGAPQPGTVFRTGQDGTCSFTFEAAADALIGASPLFIGLGSLPTGESWVRVNLEIIPPAPPEETTSAAARAGALEQAAVAVSSAASGAARAVFPAVVKLADLPVPANTVPWKINDHGQVAYLNYSQNGLLVWNGGSLVTIPQAYPGFLYVRDLNSAGKLVGELHRVELIDSNFWRTTWAFHADIGAARLSILQPDVPDLYQSWESLSFGAWTPTRRFDALNQSTFSHIAESGTAWGVRDGFQNVSTASTLGNRRNYQTEMLAGIPAAYQISSGAWTALPGNSEDFSKFQNNTVAIGPVGAISVPSAISPDASHWLLSTGASSVTVGNMLGSTSYSTRSVTRLEARPDIGLPAQLPGAVAGITDDGDIAGSGAYSTYDPYFLRNGTLIRFGAVDQVLGLANRELSEPAMVLGKKGVWLQRTDPATGLPQPLAKGANAFEYRTYQDLGASLALANLEALAVSKQGNTVVLAGTNAQGLASTVTASLVPIDIEEVISDQIAGNEANKLPTAFYGGQPNNPMVMATASGSIARMAIKMNVPAAFASSIRVGARVVGTTAVLGSSPSVASPAKTTLNFAALSGSKMYEVVAGYDANRSGHLDDSEATVVFQKTPKLNSPVMGGGPYTGSGWALADKIVIVTYDDFVNARQETDDYGSGIAVSTTYPTAAGLISAFAQGANTISGSSPPEFGTVLDASTIPSADGLSHPLGGTWNSSNQTTTHRLVLPPGSDLSEDVVGSQGLLDMYARVLFKYRSTIAAGATSSWGVVTISFADSNIDFATSDHNDQVHVALGKCKFVGSLQVSVKAKAGGGFDVGALNCYGAMVDLYDFAYGAPRITILGITLADPKQAARTQAGHASLTFSPWPGAGRVFYTKVEFGTGWFDYEGTYPP